MATFLRYQEWYSYEKNPTENLTETVTAFGRSVDVFRQWQIIADAYPEILQEAA